MSAIAGGGPLICVQSAEVTSLAQAGLRGLQENRVLSQILKRVSSLPLLRRGHRCVHISVLADLYLKVHNVYTLSLENVRRLNTPSIRKEC